eukprot:TRINITY_DN4518_c0_g4_i4.p2 TRINITY_DN4518_c0_g4~~TRINITY_DN4518_c0_g4_i4.p2  ORF type:complete len:178 (+),score=56.50 TRINITY_DN4518_c0_g4_i4:340-873(+)
MDTQIKKEEALSQERVEQIAQPADNKLVLSSAHEEEKKVSEQGFIINSRRSQKESSSNLKQVEKKELLSIQAIEESVASAGKGDSKGKIGEDVIAKGKKLTLQVKDGGKVEKGTKVELNAAGYIGSNRQAYDGVTFFGNENLNPGTVCNEFVKCRRKTCMMSYLKLKRVALGRGSSR